VGTWCFVQNAASKWFKHVASNYARSKSCVSQAGRFKSDPGNSIDLQKIPSNVDGRACWASRAMIRIKK